MDVCELEKSLSESGYSPLSRSVSHSKGAARLRSAAFESDFGLARLCLLAVPGKFRAETLVIFPKREVDTPVYGSEYIEMPKKSFAAVDFHPQNRNLAPVLDYLGLEPNCEVSTSRHYDLQGYFSPKLWLKHSESELYSEYVAKAKARLHLYGELLKGSPDTPGAWPTGYCDYMAEHDPARGILKAYFGSDFAHDYIGEFLFPQNDHSIVRFIQRFQDEGH